MDNSRRIGLRNAKRMAVVVPVLLALGVGSLVLRTRGDSPVYPVVGTMSLDPGDALTGQPGRIYNRYRFVKGQTIDYDEALRRVVGTDCSKGFSDTGYDDIREGASVTVANEKGTTIATGSLGSGRVSEWPLRCIFSFSVEVPKAKFYKFEVSHRGQVQKSFEELKADGWKVSLTLG